ncbi:MAG: serine hydrolase [Gammaproteobacteria bacterium]|nr:serine hydrolase [Gammaproteobacteria bacterium]
MPLKSLLLVLTFGLACLPAGLRSDGSALNTLLEDLDFLRLGNNVAAMGLVMVRDDRVVVLETRGLADRETNQPITDNAIFRIGSISKMFTGLAAAELQARGVLDLEQAVRKFNLGGTYSNSWQATHPITTAQLLEHSAGLTDMIKAEWDYSDPRQLPLSKTLRLYPQARRVQWQPGLHHSYSNASIGLAGLVLEQASDYSYEELLEKLVFAPLKLQDTSVLPPPADRLPTGYDTDGRTALPYWHQIFRPFAAINTSLQDMSVFLRMLIARGKFADTPVFSPATIGRVETPTTTVAARAGLRYGYGLGNYSWLRRGILFHGHGGDADGYLSKLGYTRANNSGYFLVITAFQNRTLREMQVLIENYLVHQLTARAAPGPYHLSDTLKKDIVGNYAQVSWRFPRTDPGDNFPGFRIFEGDGNLYSQHGSRKPQQLIAVSGQLFRRPADNRATLFIGEEGGAVYFQEDTANFRKLP